MAPLFHMFTAACVILIIKCSLKIFLKILFYLENKTPNLNSKLIYLFQYNKMFEFNVMA